MRTIGRRFRNVVKQETLKHLKLRDATRPGETMRYCGIDNEIVDALSEEIWETWEGADSEIRGIIDETIQNYDEAMPVVQVEA